MVWRAVAVLFSHMMSIPKLHLCGLSPIISVGRNSSYLAVVGGSFEESQMISRSSLVRRNFNPVPPPELHPYFTTASFQTTSKQKHFEFTTRK
jgi:hypothetical protein